MIFILFSTPQSKENKRKCHSRHSRKNMIVKYDEKYTLEGYNTCCRVFFFRTVIEQEAAPGRQIAYPRFT